MDDLRALESAALLDLEAKRQQRRLLEDRLSRLDAERAHVSEAVYARVRADYESRTKTLDAELGAPIAAVRQDLARLHEMAAEVQTTLEGLKQDQEELELRQRLGEFQPGELEPRLADLRRQGTSAAERAEKLQVLEARLLAALGQGSQAGATVPAAPASNPAPTPAPETVAESHLVTTLVGVAPGVAIPPRSTLASELPTTRFAPEPAAPEPAAPEPAAPEPAAPEPIAPEPATPEPAALEPITPEPAPIPAAPEPTALPFFPVPVAPESPAASAPRTLPPAFLPPPPTPLPFVPESAPNLRESSSPLAIDLAPPALIPVDPGSTLAIDPTGPTTLLPVIDDKGPSTAQLGRTTLLELAFLLPIEPIQGVPDEFPLDAVTSVGRTNHNQLQLPVPEISRQHAQVVLTADGWTVRDLGAENGTFVNNQRIKEQVLQNGDVVRFSTIGFTFKSTSRS